MNPSETVSYMNCLVPSETLHLPACRKNLEGGLRTPWQNKFGTVTQTLIPAKAAKIRVALMVVPDGFDIELNHERQQVKAFASISLRGNCWSDVSSGNFNRARGAVNVGQPLEI